MTTTPASGVYARRMVLAASAVLGTVGLYWIGRSFVVDGRVRFGNPVDTALPLEPGFGAAPLAIRAEVTRVQGNAVVRPGDKCEFLVQRHAREDGAYQCNAQVMCGEKLLYGGPQRGYFACRVFEGDPDQAAQGARRDVLGSDPSTTGQDQDGAMHVDTRAGVLRLWDDARGPLGEFRVEADILGVQ